MSKGGLRPASTEALDCYLIDPPSVLDKGPKQMREERANPSMSIVSLFLLVWLQPHGDGGIYIIVLLSNVHTCF